MIVSLPTATFPSMGTYVLRLTADDGASTGSDDVTIEVTDESLVTLDVRVSTGSDDAEERATGSVTITSADLELVFDNGGNQTVGMRFNGVTVPPGATILNSFDQFQADEAHTGPTSLTIRGQDAANPGTFIGSSGNITSRPRTAAAVSWSPAPWPTRNVAGVDQRTPNIASVIQEIVDRPDWSSGGSMVIIIDGTGERTAEAFDGVAGAAPLLHIEYMASGS